MAERGNFFKKSKEEGGEKEVETVDEELTNREEAIEEELEAGEVFVLRRYFSRYFKVPTCSTLTYLYKIGDLEEDLYVPYPAVSAVLRGVWVRIRPFL
ncbi:hypothetical protein L249_5177 [Ophiocordyceps polyrhachis-furcata BCC 54312]|uniref:Uncharacterized protein n=1 Tax=Ophiocordyceps polyrhachis-furcata BCC 54312 TaxID=1330021 RepID=A0A367L8J1_9HYPO|nr:hypothetical protein L249_5177 [Ophiocordyceps polyrhachis-furcata BCC 54312]